MANQFFNDISKLKIYNEKLNKSLCKIEEYIADGEVSKAYSESYLMEALAEKFTNLARLTPIATGNRTAIDKVTDNIISVNNIKVGYTERGWFEIKIPALLPRKEKGNASYIRASVERALNSYFSSNRHDKFSSASVLIFEHIYALSRQGRAYRDHDNIEINVITDLLALYCMIDDSPMLCKHYYTSKIGESDFTNVYIVPISDFPLWLSQKEGASDA